MKKFDGVLKRVRELEEKRGIVYAKTSGKLYKIVRFFATLFFSYTILMNLMFVLAMFIKVDASMATMDDVFNSIVTVSVCSFLSLVGIILTYCKVHIVGGVLTGLPLIVTVPFFAIPMRDDLEGFMGFRYSFYWRHFGPIVVTILLVLWITLIAVRANVKTDRMYKQVTENLFNIYKIGEGEAENISEEQWEEFLRNYNPDNYKGQFVKELAAEKAEPAEDEGQ